MGVVTKNPLIQISVSIALWGLLGGCSDQGNTSTVISPVSPSGESSTDVEVSPSVNSTVMPNATATPSPETFPTSLDSGFQTPEFGQGAFVEDFVFGVQSPECQLPCWNGLKVGISTFEDTKNIFATDLGFEVLPNPSEDPDLDGYHVSSNMWVLEEETQENPYEFFRLATWFNDTSRQLDALQLIGEANRFENDTSPARVLRELGTPQHILITPISLSERPSMGGASLRMIYANGVVWYYSFPVPIENDGVNIGGLARVCLGKLADAPGSYRMELAIVPSPIPANPENLSPIYNRFLGDQIDRREYRTFESVFGVTITEVTSVSMQQQNPCFTTRVP